MLAGQIWVVSSYSSKSFDSRYFGPVPLQTVREWVRPLITEQYQSTLIALIELLIMFRSEQTNLSDSQSNGVAPPAASCYRRRGSIGFLGWSGLHAWAWISLRLSIPVSAIPPSRLEAFCCVLLRRSHVERHARSRVFFGNNASPLLPLLLFLGCIALGSLPWIALYHRRFIEVSTIAALAILALPPLSLVTVAHPLICVGQWFPATRWLGILLPLFDDPSLPLVRAEATQRVFCSRRLSSRHVRWTPPAADPHVAAINTHFGGSAFVPRSSLVLYQQERLIQTEALKHPDSVVLFPETVVPTWSRIDRRPLAATHSARWSNSTRPFCSAPRSRSQLHKAVEISCSRADSVRTSRMFNAYQFRLAMWHFGGRDGFPLMLRYPPTIRVLNQHAAVLMCYEQLLVWPALQSLARDPDMLLAPSNDYWASKTAIPAIQHEAAKRLGRPLGYPTLRGAERMKTCAFIAMMLLSSASFLCSDGESQPTS